MAITRGIDEGDVLLKLIRTVDMPRRNPQTGFFYLEQVKQFCLVKLYSRRNRTNGFRFNESWMKAFFESINIRLNASFRDNDGKTTWIAVGAHIESVSEEQWNEAVISPVAEKRYQRLVQNESLGSHFLNIDDLMTIDLESFKSLTEEEDNDEWVDEPDITNYLRYDLETGMATFR